MRKVANRAHQKAEDRRSAMWGSAMTALTDLRRLPWALLAVLAMSSDGEDEIPACVFRSHAGRQPAARHPHRPEAHDLSDDDEEGGGGVNMSKAGGSASTLRESMMRSERTHCTWR